ncbi:hypothetical protein BH10ACI3_BH10ACI3_06370 [soil metagenome]
MKKSLSFIVASFVIALALCLSAFGQETTGNVEVTVKDTAGAVVPSVPISIVGTTNGFRRNATTDDSGFLRILQVPPGIYTVTAAATSGFVERKVEQVSVGLGRTTPVSVEMGANLGAEVTVSSGAGTELTDVNSNTTLSSELVGLIPHGINFNSILKYSAATRPEPRSGQYQIDGASGAENTFIVDGQEVTDISSGLLNRNVNLPLAILQETQVKTTGFEAEFGGALGGVINMVTKSGNNEFHGEFGVNLRSWRLEPTPAMTLLGRNTSTSVGLPVPSYYGSRRSPDDEFSPTMTLLGPIWKNRVWFSGAYAPQIFQRERELTHSNLRDTIDPSVKLPVRNELYSFYRRAERVFARVDAQPLDKLNVNSTFKWTPEINRGAILGYSSELATGLSCLGTLCGANYINQTGGRLNSVNFTAGGSYLLSSKLVLSARYGHYFLNNRLGTYGTGSALLPTVTCSEKKGTTQPPGGTQFPAGFGCVIGTGNNYPRTGNSLFDVNVRDQFDADAIYSFALGGRHEIKGGYQRNAVRNDSDSSTNDAITLYWGTQYRLGALTQTMLRALSGVDLLTAPNAVGAGSLGIYSSRVNATSNNQSYFVQDRWQPTSRLTLNLGLRMESERVPSPFEGVKGLTFSLKSKIAPRLGASYDLRGDGKTKIFGFYGLFFDRFKLGGPGRTFAASEVFYNLYFDIFPGDTLATITRGSITGGSAVPTGNTACPTGTTTPLFGRVRCVINNNTVGADDENLDPNTKPFQQREITFGMQRQLWTNYMFSARYSRKQVINAIEDTSFILAGAAGNESFITGNPGKGLIKKRFEEMGLIAPEAERQYDVLELKLDKRFADNFFFSANYSLSRLYGNYSGLLNSDEEGQRNDPNVQRVFDTPAAGFTAAGGPDNGRLATDRPHVLKAFGTYTLSWARWFDRLKSHSTDFQLFYTVSSGSEITSFVNINKNQQIILTKRGDQGRTPLFSQTDFALRHNIKFGKDGRFNLKFDADIINLWNQGILLNKGANPSGEAGNLINERGFNPLDATLGLLSPARAAECATNTTQQCWAEAYRAFQERGSSALVGQAEGAAGRNPFYNVPTSWQAKRNIRYGITFTF